MVCFLPPAGTNDGFLVRSVRCRWYDQRSVFPRTARRVPGCVAHTRMLSIDKGFDYEIKNFEKQASISRFRQNRSRIAMISKEQKGYLLS